MQRRIVIILGQSVGMTKCIEDGGWKEVLESSVILQGPYYGGNYSMRDFYQGLESALHEQVSGSILGLGPLVKNNEFYLAVNSREIRDKLIMCCTIVVKDRTFRIRSTDATRFTLGPALCAEQCDSGSYGLLMPS